MIPEIIDAQAKKLAVLSAQEPLHSQEAQNELGKLVSQMGPGEYNMFLRLFSEYLKEELARFDQKGSNG